MKRLNWKDYLECSEKLYRFYVQWIEVNPGFGSKTNAVAWNTCKSEIEKILRKEGSKKNRILQWKKAISSGKLFPPNSKDKNINYNSRDWFLSKKQKKELKEKEILKTHLYHFYHSAYLYRNYFLRELLPKENLLF